MSHLQIAATGYRAGLESEPAAGGTRAQAVALETWQSNMQAACGIGTGRMALREIRMEMAAVWMRKCEGPAGRA